MRCAPEKCGGNYVFEMLRYCSGKSYIKTVCLTRRERRVIYRLAALRYFQRLTTFHVLLISQNFHGLLSSLLFHLSHAAIEI